MTRDPARRLVLIAETADRLPSAADESYDYKLRFMSRRYIERVTGIFEDAGIKTVHYGSPREFIDRISDHGHDVVMSLWHGTGSRNQTALIPAICEAYQIRCIGVDARSRIICEDKSLGRAFAAQLGFELIDGVVVRAAGEAVRSALPAAPLVIKPVCGGMSQGITFYQAGHNAGRLEDVIDRSIQQLGQPVLVERFFPGREVMIILAGGGDRPTLFEACEIRNRVDDRFFFSHIFDAELKQTLSSQAWEIRRVTQEIGPKVRGLAERAFGALGPAHYLRVDGRWDGERFRFLEFSPTPNFHRMSALIVAAGWNGLEPSDVARLLFDLAHTGGEEPTSQSNTDHGPLGDEDEVRLSNVIRD